VKITLEIQRSRTEKPLEIDSEIWTDFLQFYFSTEFFLFLENCCFSFNWILLFKGEFTRYFCNIFLAFLNYKLWFWRNWRVFAGLIIFARKILSFRWDFLFNIFLKKYKSSPFHANNSYPSPNKEIPDELSRDRQ
jgi:hypothetical protein